MVRSTIAAETSLKEGCDISIYINKLLSEPLLEHEKTALSHSIIRQPKFWGCCQYHEMNTRKTFVGWRCCSQRNGLEK